MHVSAFKQAFRRTAVVLAAAVLALVAATADAKPAGKWRIAFNHAADNDGAIVLRIAPLGGTPRDVATRIPAGTTENKVADLVTASLRATLGTDNYKVVVDDGEDVIVKKRGKTKNFDLTLANNSLTGLDISIKRE